MPRFVILVLAVALILPSDAVADARIVIYGERLSPNNSSANEVSRDGYGAGLSAAVPLDPRWKLTALTAGIEYTNLLSEVEERRDPNTLLRTQVETGQGLFRLYLGGELGAHGRGFIRPHVAAHAAMMLYSIDVDIRIPDDQDSENDIVQDLEGESEFAFGFDTVIGVDFNIRNNWLIDVGVRYVKAFGVPQQLTNSRATDIYPDYFQIYVGVGKNVPFG